MAHALQEAIRRAGASATFARQEEQEEREEQEEPEDDVLGVAEAREKLLAAVAALEQHKPEPELSDEEAEAQALAEAIENERRLLED